jgi:uncharacterized protein YdeI (YjbR/CyaY-like superfamily)
VTAPANSVRAANRAKWRAWLKENHSSSTEAWLIFAKKGSGESSVSYEEAVQEALCFGWIDGLVKRFDEKHYMQRFTPRKANSTWSELNRKRFEKLVAEGRMTAAGLAKPPATTSKTIPLSQRSDRPPAYLRKTLKENEPAWTNFEKLPPSHRKAYIGWIDEAKKEETRQRRIAEAIALLKQKKRLGMK